MKRFFTVAILLCASACILRAQVVDTTVCDVLKAPQSFDGKIVRIKATVSAGFDQFVLKGPDCRKDVNDIWLAYPAGTKGKAGAAAIVQLQPAKNFGGTVPAANRAPVTLDKSKDFKQFDSLLSTAHNKGSGMCLGCNRYEVTATLVGRLDGVADATIQRDKSGKITGLGGFGNLNSYNARLVLQSVSDVTSKEIDYSKADAVSKGSTTTFGGTPDLYDPIAAAQKSAQGTSGSAGTQIQRAAASFPPHGQANGVYVAFTGNTGDLSAKAEGPGTSDSPDGVIYNCTVSDRLQGDPLQRAIIHVGEHVADIRKPGQGDYNLFVLEYNAWMITNVSAMANRQSSLAVSGGYVIFDSTWPQAELISKSEDALTKFLNDEALLLK